MIADEYNDNGGGGGGGGGGGKIFLGILISAMILAAIYVLLRFVRKRKPFSLSKEAYNSIELHGGKALDDEELNY